MILVEVSNEHYAFFAIMGFDGDYDGQNKYEASVKAMLERVGAQSELPQDLYALTRIDPEDPEFYGLALSKNNTESFSEQELAAHVERAMQDENAYRIYVRDWRFGRLLTVAGKTIGTGLV